MILMLLSSCSWYAAQLSAPLDPADPTPVVFEVPKGATARALGGPLEQAGLVGSGDDFTTWVRLSKEGGCIKAGRFELRRDMSAHELVAAMCGAPLPDDLPFTVVEGWRIREIDAALVEKGWAQPGEYTAAASNPSRFQAPFPLPTDTLEGYLYPETYMVIPDAFTVDGFVQRQLDALAAAAWTPNQARFTGEGARSFHDVIVMASMIEREEPTPAQRPMVAGILWKRVDAAWNLGVDATSRYTLEQWNDRKAFLKLLRDPNDPYNTRLRPGLPPTAIGNPGATAIDAALNPVESEFWYYLHDSDKVLRPAKDSAGHEANRRAYNVY